VLLGALVLCGAQPFFDTFPSGGFDNNAGPFQGPFQQPATVRPTNAPTTTPVPVSQATRAPSIPPVSAPAPSIQPQNSAANQTSAGNTSSIAATGFIRPFGTYFVDGACRNFVPVGWNRCVAAMYCIIMHHNASSPCMTPRACSPAGVPRKQKQVCKGVAPLYNTSQALWPSLVHQHPRAAASQLTNLVDCGTAGLTWTGRLQPPLVACQQARPQPGLLECA